MNDETAFLAAIAAAPDDATIPLVFADWLEEHDDPRGKWSRHPDIRPWMGKTFASPIPPILEAIAKDKGVIAARRAIEAIGEPIVPGLVELLKHQSQRVRSQACQCLKKLGPRAKVAAPALMELLADPDYSVRGKAAKALREVGADASADTSKLKAALTDDNWAVRYAASQVLGKMGAKGSVLEELVEKFQSPVEKDRIEAIEGLKHLGTVDAVTQLDFATEDKSVAVRVAAVQALGVLKHATVSPILCDRLSDPSETVREAAVEQFTGYWRQHFITPDVVDALGNRLAEKEPRLRSRACYALSNAGALLGKPAIPLLITRLEDDEPSVRAAAAEALGKIGATSPAVVAPLLERLTDEPRVAGAAANALGNWPELPASAVPALMAFFRRARVSDGWEMSVASAFRALGKVAAAPKAVLDVLCASLQTFDDSVRAAIEALTDLGPAAAPAVPDLLALLQRDHVPQGVVKALTRIGGPAFDALTAMLEGPDADARTRILQRLWDLGADGAPLLPVLMRVYHRTANEYQRWNIVRAIGRLGPAAAPVVPDLLAVLETWDRDERPGMMFHELSFVGAGLVPHLPRVAALVGRPSVAGAETSLAFLLANIAEHTPDALAPLAASLRDTNARGGLGERGAYNGVLQGLNVLAARGQIPDPAALVPDLAPLADSSDVSMLGDLITLLGKLGPPAASPLCGLLANADAGVRAKSADALAEVGGASEEALAALIHAVEDREPKVRRTAIDTLNKLKSGTPEVLAAVEAATGDTDPKVAERAAVALKKLAPKTPKPAAPKAKGKKKA